MAIERQKYKRVIRRGSSGDDVVYMKNLLLEMGWYADGITSVKSRSFGKDSVAALLDFQQNNLDNDGVPLEPDGEIGKVTWAAIERIYYGDESAESVAPPPSDNEDLDYDSFPMISKAALYEINAALKSVNVDRYEVVMLALKEAVQPQYVELEYPISVYARGEEIYNSDLSRNVMDESDMAAYLKKGYAAEFVKHREEFLMECARHGCTGADCSGGVLGLWRKQGHIKASARPTANSICGSSYTKAISKSDLIPGDVVGREGHVGLFVGGRYVVEWIGGAYGCQLTVLSDRKVVCLTTYLDEDSSPAKTRKKGYTYTFSSWTKFRRPKWYA